MSTAAQTIDPATAPQTQASKAKAAPKKTLWVEDSNCHLEFAPVRVHEIIVDGRRKPITFKANEKVELPAEEALKFLVDESFIITTAKEGGQRIVPPPKVEDDGEIRLKPDECIAKFSEIETKGLVLRAKQLPGGDAITLQTPRDQIIAFLMQPRLNRMAKVPVKGRDIEEDDRGTVGYATIGGSMDRAAVDKLFADVADDE